MRLIRECACDERNESAAALPQPELWLLLLMRERQSLEEIDLSVQPAAQPLQAPSHRALRLGPGPRRPDVAPLLLDDHAVAFQPQHRLPRQRRPVAALRPPALQ